jgi:hypothetical protein
VQNRPNASHGNGNAPSQRATVALISGPAPLRPHDPPLFPGTRTSRCPLGAPVDDEIIDPSELSHDAKSALWLYAWSFVDWRAQRREAYAHIAQIAEIRALSSPMPVTVVTDASAASPGTPNGRRRN